MTPNARSTAGPQGPRSPSLTRASAIVAPFVAAVSGGALLALTSDNVISSPVFTAHLREAPWRLFAPMNHGVDPLHSLRVWLTLMEGPVAFLLVAVLCRRASDPQRRARAALTGAVAGLALVSAFAVVQYVTRYQLHPYWAKADPDLTRSHSTFEDPNTLGSYLVLGIGLAVALALREQATRPRGWRFYLAAAASALALAALATTVSRAAWGAAALAATMLAAYGPPWTDATRIGWAPVVGRVARSAVAAASALAVVWIAARVWLPADAVYEPTNPLEAILQTADPRVPLAEVLKQRHVFWTVALHMADVHPVTGVGLGRYPRLANDYLDAPVPVDNAHNFLLQVLAEIGSVGLLAFLLIVGASAGALRAAVRADAANAGLVWGLSFAGLGFLLTLVTGHPLLLPSAQLVVGTSLAAGLHAIASARHDLRPPRTWSLVVALAVAAITLVYGVAVSRANWHDTGHPFGYSWGFYDLEQDPERRPFRWMGPEARLHIAKPAGASAMRLEFAAFPPPDEAPTTVTVEAAGQRFDVACRDGAWRHVDIPLDGLPGDATGVEIRVSVDRAIVPASLGGSDDRRALGASLRPPTFLPDGR